MSRIPIESASPSALRTTDRVRTAASRRHVAWTPRRRTSSAAPHQIEHLDETLRTETLRRRDRLRRRSRRQLTRQTQQEPVAPRRGRLLRSSTPRQPHEPFTSDIDSEESVEPASSPESPPRDAAVEAQRYDDHTQLLDGTIAGLSIMESSSIKRVPVSPITSGEGTQFPQIEVDLDEAQPASISRIADLFRGQGANHVDEDGHENSSRLTRHSTGLYFKRSTETALQCPQVVRKSIRMRRQPQKKLSSDAGDQTKREHGRLATSCEPTSTTSFI